MSKIALQVVLGAVTLIALVTGGLGMVSGALDPFFGIETIVGSPGMVQLDSLYRYYNGLWLGMGILMIPVTLRVERYRELLQAMAVMVFVGGAGRVVSMIQHGLPHPAFVVATAAELLFPLLALWQRAVVSRSPAGQGTASA